ncbi:hypothetical protein TRVL_09810 [Trypanosoma vivax]|nr:hypothetical protein TRVL_09810 [Trypanosoma vivax]
MEDIPRANCPTVPRPLFCGVLFPVRHRFASLKCYRTVLFSAKRAPKSTASFPKAPVKMKRNALLRNLSGFHCKSEWPRRSYQCPHAKIVCISHSRTKEVMYHRSSRRAALQNQFDFMQSVTCWFSSKALVVAQPSVAPFLLTKLAACAS